MFTFGCKKQRMTSTNSTANDLVSINNNFDRLVSANGVAKTKLTTVVPTPGHYLAIFGHNNGMASGAAACRKFYTVFGEMWAP